MDGLLYPSVETRMNATRRKYSLDVRSGFGVRDAIGFQSSRQQEATPSRKLVVHVPADYLTPAPAPYPPLKPRLRTAWILESGVTGHPTPGLNIDPVHIFSCGEPVKFVKDQLNWDLVETREGESVWVQSRYLTFIRPSSKLWALQPRVPGRPKPSMLSAASTFLEEDVPLTPLASKGMWTQVELPDAEKIWVDSALVGPYPPPKPSAKYELESGRGTWVVKTAVGKD